MKKLILIIPFIFILFSCGENDSVSLNGGNGTGGDGSQSSVSGGDGNTSNPNDSGDTGGNVIVDIDPGGNTGDVLVDVDIDPGGNTGDVVVDVEVPGDGSDVVVIIPPSTEDPEYNNFTNTIFDYINRDNLYYRSTLSELEKKVYDRLYDSFQSFYGRNKEDCKMYR